MKKIILSLSFALSMMYVNAQSLAQVVSFDKETIDLGKIPQNIPKALTYTVKNISKAPLMIETVTPGCGCTTADYTKTPIAPGKTGFIKASYNAAAMGAIDKQITVKFANISETKVVKLKGEVVAPKASPAASKVIPIPAMKTPQVKKKG